MTRLCLDRRRPVALATEAPQRTVRASGPHALPINPSHGPLPPATPNPTRLVQLRGIEFIPLADDGGDDLDARQNAAIKEILIWLQRRRDQTPRA